MSNRSVIRSGGSGGSTPAAIKDGIDTSLDIEQLKQDVSFLKSWFADESLAEKIEEVRAAIVALVLPVATRVPQLRPAIVGEPNQAIATPAIPAPPAGKHWVIQIMGWYDKQPTGGVLTITGSDNEVYTTVPITSAGAGFMQKNAMPSGLGFQISLTAGGTDVRGSLNYAIVAEED